MSIRDRLSALWRDVAHRPAVDAEFGDEFRSYVDLLTDEKVRAGLSPDAARRAALAEAGGAEPAREAVRDVRFGAALETTLRDLRFALRTLVKQPVFTATAVATLALAIGANAAILSVVDAVLLRPLAYGDPGALVTILNHGTGPVGPASFAAWRSRASSFSGIGAAEFWTSTMTVDGRPERVPSLRLTAEVLPLLEVPPLLGRVWSADADQPGHDHVVVLGYALWTRMFGKDPGVIGRVVTVNGEPYTVIGVMPADFAFAPFWATHAELWAPLALGPRLYDTGGWSLRVFGRLKPGHSLASARAEIASITADMERRFPHSNDDVRVRPLADLVVGSVRTPLYVVLGAVAFVLLIACANVAHMLLARGASRQREIAVRAALGASRGRTLRQLLTESLALALVGGCAGILLAIGGVRVLSVLGATSIPRVQSTTVDFRVLVAALVISAGTALAFGLVPALRATHVNLSESLKEGNRGANDAGSGGRLRNLLVVSEFALALVLLVGAGLMVRTFAALTSHDPGFNPHDMLSAQVSVAGTAEAAPGARLAFYDALHGRLRGVPGVTAVSAINHLPLAGDLWGRSFRPEGRSEPKSGIWPVAVYRVVFPGYFAAMRLPLVRGRDFTDRDAMGAPGVVIVNEHLADRSWPGEDAIGKRLALADDDSAAPNWLTVVGVVRDAAQETLTDPMQPEMYLPIRQRADYLSGPELHYSYVTVVARVGCPPGREPCDAGAVGGALRAAAAGLDPQVTVSSVETMDAVMHDATARPRFYLTLLLTFAVVALVLAAVGIYGVTSYGVSRRTHEIGLRLALGARPAQLLGSVVAESMKVAVAGALVGALGAYALARLLSGILFGVRAHDPITFVSVTLLLCAVALVASYLPARRATRIEPLTALRGE